LNFRKTHLYDGELNKFYFKIKAMLSREFLRENIEFVKEMLKKRGMEGQVDLNSFIQLDIERRKRIQEVENLRKLRNETSEKISILKRKNENVEELLLKMKEVSDKIKEMEISLEEVEMELIKIELTIPNVPHSSVPVGKDESFNKIVRKWGDVPNFSFKVKDHIEIGENLGILDFQRASKITGSRFAVLKGIVAKLERALINFMLDLAKEKGYEEVWLPFMINEKSAISTGQLPKFKEDLFKIEGWDFYLVPTAEVPLTNLHRDEVIEGEKLPLNYCAYTPCFRSEAGSYGKDVKGLIRQHQFDKIELVKFSHPDNSYQELEKLTKDAEDVLVKLGLPYQVIMLCTGDLGFGAAKCYDLEVWIPSQEKYREISSCSNFEDFQARRGNIKYKTKDMKKAQFVHTLNGSGLAVGRTLLSILENFQQEDGSVKIPEVLKKYLGGIEKIEKK